MKTSAINQGNFKAYQEKTFSLSDERLKTCYSLRRNRLSQKNFKLRYEAYIKDSKCNLEIEISNKILETFPNDFMSKYTAANDSEKVSYLFSLLNSTNEYQYIAYAIASLRQISNRFKSSSDVDNVITVDHFNTIFNVLSSQRSNESILYEIIYFILNVIVNSETFRKQFASSKDILVSLIQNFYGQSNNYIRGMLFMVFGNLIQEGEWETLNYISTSLPYFKILSDYMVTNLENIPNMLKWVIMWNIKLIFQFSPSESMDGLLSTFGTTIGKICLFVISDIDKAVFRESLDCVRVITEVLAEQKIGDANMTYMNNIFSSTHLIKNIVPHIVLANQNEFLYDIFCIITHLSYIDDDYVYDLRMNNIFPQLEQFLIDLIAKEKINAKKISLKELINFLNNCIYYPKCRKKIIRKNNIVKSLVHLVKNITDKELIKSIVEFIVAILDIEETDKSNNYIELIRLEVPELLLTIIKDCIEDKEISEKCFEGILRFLVYGNDLVKDTNIIASLYQEKGLRDIAEKFLMSNNAKIVSYCNEILNNFL